MGIINFFHIPEPITTLIKTYFQDLQLYNMAALEGRHHGWLEITPLAFTMATEVIIRASKWVVGGEQTEAGVHLPLIRACMDNMTTLTTMVDCSEQLLGKLQKNIEWALL